MIRSACVFVLALLSHQSIHPGFGMFPAPDNFRGKPATVDLRSHPDAHTYRSRLREGAAQGPNFAGHYTIVQWGCGSSCQKFAIIDAQTGKVYIYPGMTSYGMSYHRTSRMIVTDPITADDIKEFESGIPSWRMTRYFLWDGMGLTQIDSSRSVFTDK